jgi:hypothetical protein
MAQAMRAGTGFHADRAALVRRFHQGTQPLVSSQPTSPHGLAGPINTVQLEYVLCQINANVAKLHEWTPSLPVTGKHASSSLAL